MSAEIEHSRRGLLGAAAASIVTAQFAVMGAAHASPDKPKGSDFRFTPIRQVKAGVLDIG
jgi:hypothetical protein